jgi:hypothetical protein
MMDGRRATPPLLNGVGVGKRPIGWIGEISKKHVSPILESEYPSSIKKWGKSLCFFSERF